MKTINFLMTIITMTITFGFILALCGDIVGDIVVAISSFGAILMLYVMNGKRVKE